MTFGFYIKDHKDYIKFEKFLDQNKRKYKENWLFNHYETRPQYM